MGILNLIFTNLRLRVWTQKPDEPVPTPGGFRGELAHDASLCTACGTCAYVCSPTAIHFDRSAKDQVVWQYQMMSCTYCGRCVEFCPTHALKLEPRPAQPLYEVRQTNHPVPYHACPRCGTLFMPLPLKVLETNNPAGITPELVSQNNLCDRCRKKAFSTQFKDSFTGKQAG